MIHIFAKRGRKKRNCSAEKSKASVGTLHQNLLGKGSGKSFSNCGQSHSRTKQNKRQAQKTKELLLLGVQTIKLYFIQICTALLLHINILSYGVTMNQEFWFPEVQGVVMMLLGFFILALIQISSIAYPPQLQPGTYELDYGFSTTNCHCMAADYESHCEVTTILELIYIHVVRVEKRHILNPLTVAQCT